MFHFIGTCISCSIKIKTQYFKTLNAYTAAPVSIIFDLLSPSSDDPSFNELESSPSSPKSARYFFEMASQSTTFSIRVWLSVEKLVCDPKGERCETDNDFAFDSKIRIVVWIFFGCIWVFGWIVEWSCCFGFRFYHWCFAIFLDRFEGCTVFRFPVAFWYMRDSCKR